MAPTFEDLETSVDEGAPYELYEFVYAGEQYYYTDAEDDIVFNFKTFKATANLTRTDRVMDDEIGTKNIEVTMPRDVGLTALFNPYPPGEKVSLTVYGMHHGASDYTVVWLGTVGNASWDELFITLACQSIHNSLERLGLRRHYQYQCPHLHYGPACKLSDTDWEEDGTADGLSGLDLTVNAASAFADGYFGGGKVVYVDAITGATHRRMILGHTGAVLTLDQQPYTITLTQAVKLYPGCDHTIATCRDKYSNSNNYGGCPYIPLVPPTSGNNVF